MELALWVGLVGVVENQAAEGEVGVLGDGNGVLGEGVGGG